MEGFIKTFLNGKGYRINSKAQEVISVCDSWYANRCMDDFHKRKTVQGIPYELIRMNFAKRCCSDDANLCEIAEVNGGTNKQQHEFLQDILKDNRFLTMYRRQIEQVSANGTAACYIRLDNADILENKSIRGGKIRFNYIRAENFIPLTVINEEVTEAAFAGSSLKSGKVETTLVIFALDVGGNYTAETHVFDETGREMEQAGNSIQLGDIKPFAVLRNAEVNNIDHMSGYGLPKVWNAIGPLKALDLCFNVMYGDLDKADKLVIVNEMLCKFDDSGNPITPNEQTKRTFVMLGGEKLPEEKSLVTEINPVIRVDEITKAFELNLSLLSSTFGYGTKKYSFENGQIKTATEYAGERQDSMQELNKQRAEAKQYLTDICKAVLWFSNTFQRTNWNLEEEIGIDFDDSYITDRQAEQEGKRADALSFQQIPKLTVWYLMDRYNLNEKEAEKLVLDGTLVETETEDENIPINAGNYHAV